MKNSTNTGIDDLVATGRLFQAALYLTWSDTKSRYKRSVVGPLWLVLGTGVGVAGLGVLWSSLLKMDKQTFIPSLTVGLIVWQLISSCVTESATIYIKNSSVIRNYKMPYLFFPLQLIMKSTISFLHNLIVVLIVFLIYPPDFGWMQLLVIPGLVLLLGNLLWMITMIGLLGVRFRDVDPLIGAFMPMVFFLSPVVYRPSNLGINQDLLWFNPFTYLITLIRDPLQGVPPPAFVYYNSMTALVLGWILTLYVLGRKHHRVAFWV
jgi:ABC-type polysaccharide/polyol phosphate export permease